MFALNHGIDICHILLRVSVIVKFAKHFLPCSDAVHISVMRNA